MNQRMLILLGALSLVLLIRVLDPWPSNSDERVVAASARPGAARPATGMTGDPNTQHAQPTLPTLPGRRPALQSSAGDDAIVDIFPIQKIALSEPKITEPKVVEPRPARLPPHIVPAPPPLAAPPAPRPAPAPPPPAPARAVPAQPALPFVVVGDWTASGQTTVFLTGPKGLLTARTGGTLLNDYLVEQAGPGLLALLHVSRNEQHKLTWKSNP